MSRRKIYDIGNVVRLSSKRGYYNVAVFGSLKERITQILNGRKHIEANPGTLGLCVADAEGYIIVYVKGALVEVPISDIDEVRNEVS